MGSKKNTITVKQIKSSIGKHKSHRATLLGLGLKKLIVKEPWKTLRVCAE